MPKMNRQVSNKPEPGSSAALLRAVAGVVSLEFIQYHFDYGVNPVFDRSRKVYPQGIGINGFNAQDHGLRHLAKDLAERQRFQKVHLMKRILGPETAGDVIARQPIKIARSAVVADRINDNQIIGKRDNAQKTQAQHAAVNNGNIFCKVVTAIKLLHYPNAEA